MRSLYQEIIEAYCRRKGRTMSMQPSLPSQQVEAVLEVLVPYIEDLQSRLSTLEIKQQKED